MRQSSSLTRRKKTLNLFGRGSFFRNVMVVRKPSSRSSDSTSTSTSSTYPPSVFSVDWEADDEKDKMSQSDYTPSRPLSVAIPKAASVHGPYCPRRPNLREILANTSDPPWTLAAFMAYLSNNHCLETLEFTMDAGRYRKHYAKMLNRAKENSPTSKDREYVQALWQRLVDAYIRPNGSREVNLPSSVRDPILILSPAEAPAEMPPAPEKLDSAVATIYELMEESVLGSFLNSAYPQTAHPTISSYPTNRSDESLSTGSRTYEDHTEYQRRAKHSRSSPPPRTAVDPYAHSYSPPSTLNRRSAPSTTSSASRNKQRFSARISQSTSSPAAVNASGPDQNIFSGPGMTDDSGSTDSPLDGSPTTPPMSPAIRGEGVGSPKRDSGMWKKLGRLSGVKPAKKRSQGGLKEEQ